MSVSIVLKLDGIKGESKLDGHADEIDILSASFGASNPSTFAFGGGGGVGRVTIQDLSCVKYADLASINLFRYCCNGKGIPTAKLTMRKQGGDTPVDFVVYDLTDVLVSSWVESVSNNDAEVTESFSLAFAQVKVTYTSQNQDGTGNVSIPAGWNVTSNKAAT